MEEADEGLGISDQGSLGSLDAMGPDGPRDQSKPSHKQDQHHQSVEKAGLKKVDVHIGKHACQDEKRAGAGKQPSDSASTVPKQNAHAEQHWYKRNAEGVCTPEAPIGTHHAHLVGEEVDSKASHGKAHQELAQSARGASNIA
jgi:hypothetical protein